MNVRTRKMFKSILDGVVTSNANMTTEKLLICTLVSLLLGVIIAVVYRIKVDCSKNFVITLVILPILVQAAIMLVNGNLGTSVAILGVFSLIRFRSIPGTAQEITAVFFTMAIGLATGMGFIGFAILITCVVSILIFILNTLIKDESKGKRILRIVIPEELDYVNVFADIFEKYTTSAKLERVKTTNLGSMFELQYCILLKEDKLEKEFIDEIRCRNGNLMIVCSQPVVHGDAPSM